MAGTDKPPYNHKKIAKQSPHKGVSISKTGIQISLDRVPVKAEKSGTGFVYLVIDCSGSMAVYEKLDQAKRRAVDFARKARPKGYSVGLVQFSDVAIHICKPQREISVLEQHLKNLTASGGTNMGDGIRLAKQNLKNNPGVLTMLVVTDGMPNSQEDALAAAREAKNQGIDIIAIGTDDADVAFLKAIASRSDLATKVSRKQLGQAIVDAAKMLPDPRSRQ